MEEQFYRVEMMLGPAAMEKLAQSHVVVMGVGGVGSWCAEALARSGVGTLTLIDHDVVGLSNLNRQAQATHSTLGQNKVDAMANRIHDLNPNCTVHPVIGRYSAQNRDLCFGQPFDYLVDAIDLVSCKLDLIEQALEKNIPIISALGTGNKLNPALLHVTDIAKTEGCPLARIIRKELRHRGIRHHKVVFSPEQPAQTDQSETPPPGRRSVPASVPWVPATAGFLLAGQVVQDLIQ